MHGNPIVLFCCAISFLSSLFFNLWQNHCMHFYERVFTDVKAKKLILGRGLGGREMNKGVSYDFWTKVKSLIFLSCFFPYILLLKKMG